MGSTHTANAFGIGGGGRVGVVGRVHELTLGIAVPASTALPGKREVQVLGSAAAIVWCISYPSYLSAPFVGLVFCDKSFVWLAVVVTIHMVTDRLRYRFGISRYASNFTTDFVADYSGYALWSFDYLFSRPRSTYLSTLCLVLIFLSIRIRWRYQDVLGESH